MQKKLFLSSALLVSSLGFADLPEQRSYRTFVTAEFLYWKFTPRGLEFGRDGVGITNSASPQEVEVKKAGTVYFPRSHFQPGYRLGLGFKFGPNQAFDLYARYTWIYSTGKRSVSEDQISASFLPISWLTSNTPANSIYQFASSHVRIHFHSSEIQSGYTFKINPTLTLRPYAAVTAYFVDAGQRVEYKFTTPSGIFEIARDHAESFSWSVGPKIGLDFILNLPKGFGIFTNGNITHQAGQFTAKAEQTQDREALGQEFVIQKAKVRQQSSFAVVGLEIGPSWDYWFYDRRYRIQLRVTWQTLTLGNNFVFLNNNDIPIFADATYRGVNFRALFEF